MIPGHVLEQVNNSLPKPEKPLRETMTQVQNRLDEEKKLVESWKQAVKAREAVVTEGNRFCQTMSPYLRLCRLR